MQLFYNDSLYPQVQEVTFDKEESNHIHKVLRKKTGDLLFITDGRGYLYKAQIQYITDKKCTAHVITLKERQSKLSALRKFSSRR